MKIAFCLFKYFPFGGLQRDFWRIADVCRQRGHEIHVYTTEWQGDKLPGMHLHLIKPAGWQNHTRFLSYTQQVAKALARDPVDCVVGFNKMPHLDLYYAADVCFQAKARQKHGWLSRCLPRYRQWQAMEQAVFQAGQSTDILLISPHQQPAFEACYQTEASRFHLLPPGIARDRVIAEDADRVREQVRERHGIQTNDHLLLAVGSGFKTKGLDRTIRALASLPEAIQKKCQLLVIGQDHAQPFQRLANQLQVSDRVHFLGGRNDVRDYMLAADVLMHPAYHENTGTVILEAMVSGLPVLTTDSCGYAHYVKEASAGQVMGSPFDQAKLNLALVEILQTNAWADRKNKARDFAASADIYSLPEKAADLIEQHSCFLKSDQACLQKELIQYFRQDQPLFGQLMSLSGEAYRQQKGRLTQRIQLGQQHYFIKQHFGVGVKEIMKNVIAGRWPVTSAENEWQAIQKLNALGILTPEVVGYGKRGKNPASIQSFVLMKEVAPAVSLETLGQQWQTKPPSALFKRQLIQAVARIAKVMHENGIHHRDFYLCHFLLNTEKESDVQLSLIDLHRAGIQKKLAVRWVMKDLAGLYFSSKDIGLTTRDLCRFMQHYRGQRLSHIIRKENHFWQAIKKRGEKLYRDHLI